MLVVKAMAKTIDTSETVRLLLRSFERRLFEVEVPNVPAVKFRAGFR